MKIHHLYATIIAFGLVSCGGQEGTDIDKLKTQRDSLKGVYKDLALEISSLETKILELDTTVKRREVLVTVQELKPTSFSHYIEVQGIITSDQQVSINPEVPGEVKRIAVKTGMEVKKGQVIMELDTEIMRKNLEELKSAYQLANTMFEKQNRLWQQKIGSEVQYLQSKNQKESLALKMESLEAQIKKAVITSPVNGVIDEIFINQGENANPMMPVVRVVNMQQLYAKADVSENYLSKVKVGSPIGIDVAAIDFKQEAKLSRIGNYIDPNNRTFKIEVDLNESSPYLKPNLVAKVKILDNKQDSVLVVPSSVIQQDASQNDFLYIVDNTEGFKAKKVLITRGLSYKGNTVITSGIEAGQKILVQGARTVAGGEWIKIVED